jgi:pimeloyl-ACP methyl ester carboxylesterase
MAIHYYKWGTGDKLLICFHGYGESADSFSILQAPLANEFTILAIDLPFHGQTDWKETLFTVEDLLAFIEEITAGTPAHQQEWWLMGYSMGGRIALSLLEKAPERVCKLVLLAPDGLIVNPWYWLATQTSPGRALFKWTMYHPGWFFFVLRTGNTLKLVNPSVYKFVAKYIGRPQIREVLYKRWTGLRPFRPRIAAVKSIIRRQQLPVRILYGRFDRIIRVERGEQFRKGIEPWCQLTILPAGHQLLHINHLDTLVSLLKE